LYYQVETLVIGNALSRACEPERLIVGLATETDQLSPAYSTYLKQFNAPVLEMDYESAELAKIAINCFLASTVSTTNMLAELCEKIGAHWHSIMPALRMDKRIGPHAYLQPGLGISGGNIERDITTVCNLGASSGTNITVAKAWQQNSEYRKDSVLRMIYEEVAPLGSIDRIAIWGLAYKPGTGSVKNSPSLALISSLRYCALSVYDPIVDKSAIPACFGYVNHVSSPMQAIEGADLLIIMTPWPEFSECDLNEIAAMLKTKTIIDPFGILDARKSGCVDLKVLTLGKRVKSDRDRDVLGVATEFA
jgi:UDPglucose 6-dehydrogenase